MPERIRFPQLRPATAGLAVAGLLAGCRSHPADLPAFQAQAIDSVLAQFAPAYDAYHNQQPSLAARRFDSILATRPQPAAPFVLFMRQGLLYDSYKELLKDPARAALQLDTAIRILEKDALYEDYPGVYADALCKRAQLAFDAGAYQQAYDYYFRAEQVAGQSKDSGERALYRYNVGMVLYRQRLYPAAVRYFQAAYQLLSPDAAVYLHRRQELLDNIALCLINLRQYEAALYHLRLALDLAERHRKQFGSYQMANVRGVILGNMGRAYAATGRTDSAIRCLRESIALNSKPGAWNETRSAAEACALLADICLQQQQYEAAATTIDALEARLQQSGSPALTMEWLRLKDAYQQATVPAARTDYYRSHIRLRDSFQHTAASNRADITEQLRSRGQALQIRLLRQDLKLRWIYNAIIAAVALLTTLTLGLIYYGYRRSKRNVRLLQVLNRRVRDQKQALEQALGDKDRVLHVVAHDLRSPVALTSYLADLIRMEDEEGRHAELLQMIGSASGQATKLIEDLLHLKTGPQVLPKQRIDLHKLLTGLAPQLRHQAAQKEQVLDVEAGAGPAFVRGDAEELTRLLANLAGNAIKFSHRGGRIALCLERQGDQHVLAVADQGIGIPAALQPRIFDLFTQARQPGTDKEHSHGLGLAICKQIAERHRGTIRVESAPGQGATFTVSLPATA